MFARLTTRAPSVRLAPLLLAGCLAFAGCADTAGLTPAQQALQSSQRRFAVTTAEGAGAGALLGALVGGLAGGGRGALIGAAAGGLAGGVAGAAVAQNNYERNRNENTLSEYIASANEQAADAQTDANTAAQIAREARAKTAQLRAQYRAGQIDAAQYRAQIASYSKSLDTLRSISASQSEQIADYRRNGSTAGPQGATLISASNVIARSKMSIDHSIDDIVATLQAAPN